MYKKRASKKRLAVDLPLVLHKELKVIADRRYCTITSYLIQVIRRAISQERYYE